MRRIYVEYFQVPENGKVRDNVLNTRLTVGIIGILLCLLVMSLTAFAYFSHTVSSQTGDMSSARFDVRISASATEDPSPQISSDGTGGYRIYLKKDAVYTVSLVQKGTATTGFCRVTADGAAQEFHTAQLGTVEGREVSEISFRITLSEPAYLTVTPCWGTSSYYGRETEPAVAEVYLTGDGVFSVTVDPSAQTLGRPVWIVEPSPTETGAAQPNPSEVQEESTDSVQDEQTPSDTEHSEEASGTESAEDIIADVTDSPISSESDSDLSTDAADGTDSSEPDSEGEITDSADGYTDSEENSETASAPASEAEASDGEAATVSRSPQSVDSDFTVDAE